MPTREVETIPALGRAVTQEWCTGLKNRAGCRECPNSLPPHSSGFHQPNSLRQLQVPLPVAGQGVEGRWDYGCLSLDWFTCCGAPLASQWNYGMSFNKDRNRTKAQWAFCFWKRWQLSGVTGEGESRQRLILVLTAKVQNLICHYKKVLLFSFTTRATCWASDN